MDENELRDLLAEEIGKVTQHPVVGGYCAVAVALAAMQRAFDLGMKCGLLNASELPL